jgi:tripartite-type tricarboxylate transporter receptor subunit TctC
MSPGLGQQIVVENRPGSGGIVGSEMVARSPGDGYSMLNIQASFVDNAALRPRLPYEPIADFAYVGMMARGPLLMVVHPSLPVKNVREFLALAKSKPGLVNYGSTGTGSHNHMATELFRRMAGINIIHVPSGLKVDLIVAPATTAPASAEPPAPAPAPAEPAAVAPPAAP